MKPGPRLPGKVAIVTGGASGIGAETARTFAMHGAKVLLTDTNATLGEAVAKEITTAGGTASFMVQNVVDEAQWTTIVAEAEKRYGRVDILCNIAGISGRDPKLNIQTSQTAGPRLAEQTLEQWNQVMEINATGVFLGTKYAVAAMKAGTGGSIVNLSSIAGIIGSEGIHMAYNASKGAVRLMTKSTAVQHAQDKIRCNSVHPGVMPPMRTSGRTADPIVRANRMNVIPMRRPGEVDEVANAILFLASDEASYITGTELVVDGGAIAI